MFLKKFTYIIITITLYYLLLSFINKDVNKQNLKDGVWVGYETLLPINILNADFLFKNYKNIYVKSDLDFIKFNSSLKNRNIYYWYEDGLSLNYLTPYTKKLVFPFKVDGKYWLDISKPEAKRYILTKLTSQNDYKIHLDDHWAIPYQYGDYSKELNLLTKELVNKLGPISLSVLPSKYAKQKYNVDWKLWLDNNYLSEIILQNYTEKNFDYELKIFKKEVEDFKGIKAVGVYIRNSKTKNRYKDIIVDSNLEVRLFSLRTDLIFND